ncbi:hypothetical protein C8A01DRAFT_36572 [Parachaetomium inaequale]|uniref:Uncharacterized protein n=1 Tax=Parachaetomium inaequale TaxID=2588326 RepID=A0AAN6PJ10_9PEZI|nr:hypothetical protein C8A01DRAFT_36572 [Parachaetomium inaequale]
MEDDDTAEEESENGEAEDHEMGDGNAAVDDGAAGNEAVAPGSSTDDKPDEEPLKADSPWPDEPSREMVLRLAECSWLDERLASGQRPDPTARDAIMSAFSSLHFLDCLKGSALNSDNLGIDHAGHVFEIRPDGWVQRDYRRDFSDLRSTLRRKASDASATDEIRKQIRTYMDFDATGLLWESADVETENLVRLVRDMVRQNDFAVPKLKSIRAECEKAMAEMGKTVALANAVKQDLLDTGSTSLKRWKQLRSIGRRLGWSIGRMAVPEMPTPKDIDELVEDITQDSASYHRCFGYTLKLKWDLDSAIDDLSY